MVFHCCVYNSTVQSSQSILTQGITEYVDPSYGYFNVLLIDYLGYHF